MKILHPELFIPIIVSFGIVAILYLRNGKKWKRIFVIFGALLSLYGILEQAGIIENPSKEEKTHPNPIKPDTVEHKQAKKPEYPDAGTKKDEPIKETPVNRKKIEATGTARGYFSTCDRALDAAVKNAREKLEDRGISTDSYEIDNNKKAVILTDYGWTATVEIFVYK